MEYAIPLALVVLVITALITLFVMRAMRTRGSAGSSEPGGPGIGGDDETPLADTSEHAGDQHGGEDVGPVDAEKHGGAGRRTGQGYTGTGDVADSKEDREIAAHVQRPGEGEGATRF